MSNDDRRYCRQKPCSGCPFGKKTTPGALGGSPPATYIGQALGPFLLSCHMDPEYDKDPRSTQLHQCAGAAMFRDAVGVADQLPAFMHRLKSDPALAFTTPADFVAHHMGITLQEAARWLQQNPPEKLRDFELQRQGVHLLPQVDQLLQETMPPGGLAAHLEFVCQRVHHAFSEAVYQLCDKGLDEQHAFMTVARELHARSPQLYGIYSAWLLELPNKRR